MTKNRTPTPVYLDPGMHSGLEVKGLIVRFGPGQLRYSSAMHLAYYCLRLDETLLLPY